MSEQEIIDRIEQELSLPFEDDIKIEFLEGIIKMYDELIKFRHLIPSLYKDVFVLEEMINLK